MTLEDQIRTIHRAVSDAYDTIIRRHGRIRKRGPAPMMRDVDLLTLEIFAEIQGMTGDRAIWRYLDGHWRRLFPTLPSYKTFARQSGNLHSVKFHIFMIIFAVPIGLAIIDSIPLPVAQKIRAGRSNILKGEVAWGYNASKRMKYYGFKGHMVVGADRLIRMCFVTPANMSDLECLECLIGLFRGTLLGDKGYISKWLKYLLAEAGIDLQTPLRRNMKETRSEGFLKWMGTTRHQIESVFSVLVERFNLHKIKAHASWRYLSKLHRKLLAHNFYVMMKA